MQNPGGSGITTTMNSRDEFRNVSVTVTVTEVGVVEVGVVDARYGCRHPSSFYNAFITY